MTGARPLVPEGWRLRARPELLTGAGGTVLVGGAPLRVLRLTPQGARTVACWWAGEPVGAARAERRLARRLLDAGMAEPEPPPGPAPIELTVVVPVHERPDELRRCLASLDRRCRVVVVDDGSSDRAPIAAAAAHAGAAVLRHPRPAGASAARNTGLAAVGTAFVAFVDSDCVVPPGFPGRLLDHLGDPAVAAVAPRVTALDPGARGLLARYETAHSALDMGAGEGLVRPGGPVGYVPSAVLVVRTAALAGVRFDERLAIGEDVDLVWRLHDAGWQVRYDPAVRVRHDHRTGLRPWFRRRVAYNASNAPLEHRHPGRVPALSLSRGGALALAAVATGHPVVALASTAASSRALARVLAPDVPHASRAAARLVLRGHLHEARHATRALTGPWLPLLLAATALRPSLGRRLWTGVAAAVVGEWVAERTDPTPLHLAAGRALEDLARCVGVWRGCLGERSVAALLPRVRAAQAPR